MVKLKSSLWLLFIIILICCGIGRAEQRNIQPKKINEYFNLNVKVNSDTILLGNEISITIIITNKTDSSFYFHSEALLYMANYIPPHIFIAGDDPPVFYFSDYDDVSKLILIEPCARRSVFATSG